MRSPKPKVAVVGGGIAGLSAAWYLNQSLPGADVMLFEAARRMGGKVITHYLDGDGQQPFVLEGGADAFLAKQKPWAYELALALGLADRLLPTQDVQNSVYVVDKSTIVPLPKGLNLILPTDWEAFVRSPLVSAAGKARMAQEREIPAVAHDADESVTSFVTRRLGIEALEKLGEPLMSGIYSAHPEEQSVLATFPRFRQLEKQYGSLLRAGEFSTRQREASADRGTGTGPSSTFVSFVDGTEELVRALAARIKAKIHLNTSVDVIERESHGFRVQFGDESIFADAIVLAIPAQSAAMLLRRVVPQAAAELEYLRTVSSGVVYLGYRQEQVVDDRDGYGIVIPRAERRDFNALTLVSRKFAHRTPPNHVMVRLFFGGARSPHMMERSDDEIAKAARRELDQLMGIKSPPLFAQTFRWWNAQPQYDVGHLDRMARIAGALPPGMSLIGTAYGGVGIPDCVRQGHEAAQKLARYLSRVDSN